MPKSQFSFIRRVGAVGIAAALSLGLAACSPGGDKADSKKPKPDESSSAGDDIDYAKIAEESLLSADMAYLSDHKPQYDEPEHQDRLPFGVCELDKELYGGVKDSVVQLFDGDPKLAAEAYAVEGSAQEQFEAMREVWQSKECESFTADTPDGEFEYKWVEEIDAPETVDKKAWYSACFTLTKTGSGGSGVECRMVYVAGENSIAEVWTQDLESADDPSLLRVLMIAVAAASE